MPWGQSSKPGAVQPPPDDEASQPLLSADPHASDGLSHPTEVTDYKTLIDPNQIWWRHSRLRQLNLWILLYLIGNCANGYDGALVVGLQILPAWQRDFNHPTGSRLGLVGAIQNIGSLGSIPVAPLWNDRFGRRWTVMLGSTFMIIGALLQTTSKDLSWFLGGRALLGFGGGFNNNGDPLMVMELCYPTHRAPISGSYNSLTGVGSIAAALVTFGTYYLTTSWSWRLPLLLQIIPTSIQLCLVMLGPESPRWLMSKGLEAEAFQTLSYYHGNGHIHDPLVLYEFEEIKNAIAKEQEAKQYGWRDLFGTKGMRRRSYTMMALAVCGQWSGNSMVSYYLNQVLNTIGLTNKVQQLGINLSLSLWHFMCGFTSGINADRFGRRQLFLLSTAGMFVFFVAVTIGSAEYSVRHNAISGDLVVLFIFLFTGFYAIGWSSVLLLYVTEIVPFSLRSKAHSLFAITQASNMVCNQYINPVVFAKLGWKYYIVFDVIIIAIFLFVWFFVVETKGHTLEETALLYDGDDAVAALKIRSGEQAAVDAESSEVIHDQDPPFHKASAQHRGDTHV